MATTIDRTSHENLVFIKKDGGQRTDVAIFAHGKKCSGDFSINGEGITLNFYIKDEALFNFVNVPGNDCFSKLRDDKLLPYEIYDTNSKDLVPNYELNKAAGTHIDNVNARISYTEMEALVDKDDINKIHFDVISIRNRKINFSQQTLKSVVNAGKSRGYKNFHLFFCRATKDGKEIYGNKAPQVKQPTVKSIIHQ